MASLDDIDTKQSVGKFLQRQSVTPRADNTANTADEITAVLETVAISFLLYPQAALTIILNAKNSLQQVAQADLSVIQFIQDALNDVENRDVPINDTSDLIEAQTALIELDRLGRVDATLQAFGRYQDAINRFLDQQLAPTLKRNGTGTLERTGDEARQDIFSILSQFAVSHGVMISMLTALQKSVDDFQSVNLTNLVSVVTLSRVRASLTRVKNRIQNGTISKTTAAIELLSGSASLSSISNVGDIFDPTVKTGTFPTRTNITLSPEDVKATVLSSDGPWDLTGASTPWLFVGTMDTLGPAPQSFSFEIPGSGVSGHPYVSSEGLTSSITIPASRALFLHIQGSTPADFEIALPTGATSIATLVSTINTALSTHGGCVANPNTNGLIIYAKGSGTQVAVRMSSSGSLGTVSSSTSFHRELGFFDGQVSAVTNVFTPESLRLAIHNQLPSGTVVVEATKLRITSTLTDSDLSSISFGSTSTIQDNFGFTGTTEAKPSYVEMIDGSTIQDPSTIGVYVGSVVTAAEEPSISGSAIRTLNNESIVDIQGTKLFFSPSVSVPRRVLDVSITSPVVASSQELVVGLQPFISLFGDDVQDVQRILSPIISKPTKAQISDAGRVLSGISTKLQNLISYLQGIVVRTDRTQYSDVASQVISALEERGLDRAQELLSGGQFSTFFSLSSANASKSNRLLTAMEAVTQQDLPVTNLEVDMDDDQVARGTNPDSNVLAGSELSTSGSLFTDG